MTRFAILVVLPMLLIVGSAVGAPAATVRVDSFRWTQRTPATNPAAREEAAMAYDAASRKTVLFGGFKDASTAFGDTWTWDGASWTQQHPATSPPARMDAAIATDPRTGHVVLFGGSSLAGAEDLGDTWTWDGATWTQRHPATSPSARGEATMAADPTTGKVVLFGGRTREGPGYQGDTWAWDGVTWTQLHPRTSPTPRTFPVSASDFAQREVVLYGGIDMTGTPTDTWTWDGATWTEQHPRESPRLSGVAIATDPAQGRVLMFGGNNISAFVDETWTWEGTTWLRQPVPTSPPPRVEATMAPDAHGRVVLFGGLVADGLANDTWSLTPGLTVTPDAGSRRTAVVVHGYGFTPNTTAKVRYLRRAGPHAATGYRSSRRICSAVVSSDGSFTCAGRIPNGAGRPGPHDIRARDTSGLKTTAALTLTTR